jgi:hypothetical protein
MIPAMGQERINWQILANQNVNLAPGARDVQQPATVTASSHGLQASKTFNLGLNGPATGTVVPEISGVVVNLFTSAGIPNATITATDTANHQFVVGTDTGGRFAIVPMAAQVIEPGTITFVVTKNGFQDAQFSATAHPGQPLDGVRIVMRPGPSPSPS